MAKEVELHPTPTEEGWKNPAADMAIILSRKQLKQLGKEEYNKAFKNLFKAPEVHHVDIVMTDGGVVRFVR